MTTRLDVINEMLASIGTSALVSTDDRHPNYIKANNKLTVVEKQVQAHGYWFNKGTRTFNPQVDGTIIMPDNILHADPVDRSKGYSLRDRFMYDMDAGSLYIGEPVECAIVELVKVHELPSVPLEAVRATAVYAFYLDNNGTEPRLSEYRGIQRLAMADLRRESLKYQDVNYFDSASYAQLKRPGAGIRRLPLRG